MNDERQEKSLRTAILKYVKEKYNTRPDYPWKRDPNSAVLRHEDSRKWYGLIMNIQKSRLGLSDDATTDILNVRTDDPMFHDMMIQREGYLPGYHMNRQLWLTILLDGTAPFEEVCGMIDVSYKATASAKEKQRIRPPKEWIIPANPKYYDVEHAFDNADEIEWKQGRGVRVKDTVYLYVAAPVSAILYQCNVTETDIPYHYQDENLTIQSTMKIKLLKRYQPDRFTFDTLKQEYGIYAIRGPRGIPGSLSAALKK